MTIELTHEDTAELKAWRIGLEEVHEKCYFCATPTVFWHLPTNKPVCEECASTHTVSELPKRKQKN